MNVRESFQKQLGDVLGSCVTKVLPLKGSSALTGKPYGNKNRIASVLSGSN